MKSQLKMEEFSGYQEERMKQDIDACAFVYNIISDIICSKENLNEIKQERYQYEMAFNRNYAAGALKHHFEKQCLLRPTIAKKAVTKIRNIVEEEIE